MYDMGIGYNYKATSFLGPLLCMTWARLLLQSYLILRFTVRVRSPVRYDKG